MHGKPLGPLGLPGTIEFFFTFTESFLFCLTSKLRQKENIKQRIIKRGVEVYTFLMCSSWLSSADGTLIDYQGRQTTGSSARLTNDLKRKAHCVGTADRRGTGRELSLSIPGCASQLIPVTQRRDESRGNDVIRLRSSQTIWLHAQPPSNAASEYQHTDNLFYKSSTQARLQLSSYMLYLNSISCYKVNITTVLCLLKWDVITAFMFYSYFHYDSFPDTCFCVSGKAREGVKG